MNGRTIPLVNVDHRFFDAGEEVGTLTKLTLPSIEVSTTTVNASGMLGPMDVPNTNQINAMSYTLEYTAGPESGTLARPGMHTHELRLVEEVFDRVDMVNILRSVKYRFKGVLSGVSAGDVEKGAKASDTATYQCVRYEKYVDGESAILVDKVAGQYQVEGVDYAADVRSMLE